MTTSLQRTSVERFWEFYDVLRKYYPFYDFSLEDVKWLTFLLDWKVSLEEQKVVIWTNYYFDHYDICDTEISKISHDDFISKKLSSKIEWIWLSIYRALRNKSILDKQTDYKKYIPFIIKKYLGLRSYERKKFLYSIYPYYLSEKYTNIDLVDLAEKYKTNN